MSSTRIGENTDADQVNSPRSPAPNAFGDTRNCGRVVQLQRPKWKIDLETGDVVWAAATGISPYGASLSADESEVWVANKGEQTGHLGRTVTVIDTKSGRTQATLFSGYEVDHILLAPNGKEMWATSNGEGSIYVFDVASREQLAVIAMPQNGDPHGLVWVHYDEDGNSKVVRDQNSFHGGVNPALGTALDY